MEWKTIRLDAASYYKLNELSGLFTYVFGSQMSISNVASMVISNFYIAYMPTLQNFVTDPKLLLELREKIKSSLLDVAKVSDQKLSEEIIQYIKEKEEQEREVKRKIKE